MVINLSYQLLRSGINSKTLLRWSWEAVCRIEENRSPNKVSGTTQYRTVPPKEVTHFLPGRQVITLFSIPQAAEPLQQHPHPTSSGSHKFSLSNLPSPTLFALSLFTAPAGTPQEGKQVRWANGKSSPLPSCLPVPSQLSSQLSAVPSPLLLPHHQETKKIMGEHSASLLLVKPFHLPYPTPTAQVSIPRNTFYPGTPKGHTYQDPRRFSYMEHPDTTLS